jgi:hypothetical protein
VTTVVTVEVNVTVGDVTFQLQAVERVSSLYDASAAGVVSGAVLLAGAVRLLSQVGSAKAVVRVTVVLVEYVTVPLLTVALTNFVVVTGTYLVTTGVV